MFNKFFLFLFLKNKKYIDQLYVKSVMKIPYSQPLYVKSVMKIPYSQPLYVKSVMKIPHSPLKKR